MYDVEKRSTVLANANGFMRRYAYIYIYIYIRSRNKMAVLGNIYTLGQQTSRSPERCTSRNATSAKFLEFQIPPRILVHDWDP